jgi:hypothetical protein
MGMFDYLECLYPLPDHWEPQGRLFQTHDTPAQQLSLYVLTAEGQVRERESGALVPVHGTLTFSASNICAMALWGIATEDDTAPWEAEYCALFDHGRLLKLEGGKRFYATERHITREAWYAQQRATATQGPQTV